MRFVPLSRGQTQSTAAHSRELVRSSPNSYPQWHLARELAPSSTNRDRRGPNLATSPLAKLRLHQPILRKLAPPPWNPDSLRLFPRETQATSLRPSPVTCQILLCRNIFHPRSGPQAPANLSSLALLGGHGAPLEMKRTETSLSFVFNFLGLILVFIKI